MCPFWRVPWLVLLFQMAVVPLRAVLFLETGDPAHNASNPGDNAGWQYMGNYNTCTGVPIAPYYFLTAKHLGNFTTFTFHGDVFTVVAYHTNPDEQGSDLILGEVNRPFASYAPLSSGAADVGGTVSVIGRGSQRGAEVNAGGTLRGWKWSAVEDHVQRWGRNMVNGAFVHSSLRDLMYCDFDDPGMTDECHISVGDSGGGLFVFEEGTWRLAGIQYSVDGPFQLTGDPAAPEFNAALFDAGGMFFGNQSSIPDDPANVPSSFYSSRVGTTERLDWIQTKTGVSGGLCAENYAAWLTLYFSPTERADAAKTGGEADADGDGVTNLLEFAFNLDPSFPEAASMTETTGVRGLPLIRREVIEETPRLTMEFVRRKASGGADVSYTPEFSTTLAGPWSVAGTETVTPINSRWERVKVIDAVAAGGGRFGRVRVVRTP